MTHRSRQGALDGLRALAVGGVLLFHGGVSWAQGGFLGVDLFFVLSGFLITGLLLEEFATHGRVRLGAFFARRARRLLPALYLMLAVVVGVIATSAGGLSRGLRDDALSTLTDLANWRFAGERFGYFEQQSGPSPLEHMWSLAIEAQFYLVWPLLLVLALVLSRGRRRLIGVLAGLGVLASAIGTAVAVELGVSTRVLYLRSDSRAQALLMGALLAVVLGQARVRAGWRRWVHLGTWEVVGLAALAATGLLWTVARDEPWLYSWGLIASSTAAAALIAAVSSSPRGLLARGLSVPPLVWLGRISYGVYLWHWPVDLALTTERTELHGPWLLAARLSATVLLAAASWWLVETPVSRARLEPFVAVPLATLTASASALILASAYVLAPVQAGEAFARASTPVAVAPVVLPVKVSALAPPWFTRLTRTPRLVAHHAPRAVPKPSPTPRPTVAPTRAPAPRPAPSPTPKPAPKHLTRVTILGDSVAQSIARGLEPVDTYYGTNVIDRGILGCGIAVPQRYKFRGQVYTTAHECNDWEQTWAADIARDRPKVALVVVGRHEVWDGELGGRWTHIGDPEFDAYLEDQLDKTIEIASARGARVAMATSPYFHGPEAPDGSTYPENLTKRVDLFNAMVRAAVARHSKVAFLVDLGHKACPYGHYSSTVDGVRIRDDGVHFTSNGGRWLAPWLLPKLR